MVSKTFFLVLPIRLKTSNTVDRIDAEEPQINAILKIKFETI